MSLDDMEKEDGGQDHDDLPEIHRFHEIEWDKLFVGLATIQTNRANVAIFFATMNLGVMSFSISLKIGLISIFAGIWLWLFIFLDAIQRGYLVAAYYRIIKLRKLYGLKNRIEYMEANYLNALTNKRLEEIMEMEDVNDRVKALRLFRIRSRTYLSFYIPLAASITEIAIGIWLWSTKGINP